MHYNLLWNYFYFLMDEHISNDSYNMGNYFSQDYPSARNTGLGINELHGSGTGQEASCSCTELAMFCLDWEKMLIGCLPSTWDLGETGQGMKELLEEMVRTWKTRSGHPENAAS